MQIRRIHSTLFREWKNDRGKYVWCIVDTRQKIFAKDPLEKPLIQKSKLSKYESSRPESCQKVDFFRVFLKSYRGCTDRTKDTLMYKSCGPMAMLRFNLVAMIATQLLQLAHALLDGKHGRTH